MSSEFTVLREAWLALDEPTEEVCEAARARLFEEIASEESERLGRSSDQQPRQGGLRRRSRLVLAVILGLLLVLTWATLTLAFGWHVIFGSAPRVPHSSKTYEEFDLLDVGAPPGMASGVIPNETRLVATYDGIPLWVAPTRAGGYCSLMAGSGGCDREGTIPLNVSYSSRSPAGGGTPQTDLAYLRELHGAVNARWSDSVEVRFEDGTAVRPRIVWISEPISEGFFYVPIGDDHRRAGHRLREVVALDAAGNVVERDNSMHPFESDKLYSDSPPAGAVIDRAEEATRVPTRFGEAVLWHAPSRFDTTCTWLELAGRFYLGQRFHGCQIKGYSTTWQGELARRGDVVFFYAAGIPSDGTVKLEFADGHHLSLSPDRNGFLLYRVPHSATLASGQPTSYTVVAESGKKLLRSPLSIPFLVSPAYAQTHTVHLPDGETVSLPRNAIVAKAHKPIAFRAEIGTRVTLWVIPTRDGGRCYVFDRGSGCSPPGSLVPPLGAGLAGGEPPVLLAGQVRPDVATYELHYEDGAIERVHPVENFILHEIRSSHYARGHRLELVIARARDGHELARQDMRTDVGGVYPCKKPVDIGHGGHICP